MYKIDGVTLQFGETVGADLAAPRRSCSCGDVQSEDVPAAAVVTCSCKMTPMMCLQSESGRLQRHSQAIAAFPPVACRGRRRRGWRSDAAPAACHCARAFKKYVLSVILKLLMSLSNGATVTQRAPFNCSFPNPCPFGTIGQNRERRRILATAANCTKSMSSFQIKSSRSLQSSSSASAGIFIWASRPQMPEALASRRSNLRPEL